MIIDGDTLIEFLKPTGISVNVFCDWLVFDRKVLTVLFVPGIPHAHVNSIRPVRHNTLPNILRAGEYETITKWFAVHIS